MGQIINLLLATGFGFGFSPVASGTVGALIGVVIVLVLGFFHLGILWQIIIALVLVLIGFPICENAEKYFNQKDDHRIVADEYLTFPICVIGLPYQEYLWLLLWAFFFHRLFDVIKPPPARGIQKLAGGAGVMLDDVFSSLYALACCHAVWWIYQYLFL